MVMKQLKEKQSLNKMSEILDEGVNLIAIYILTYNRDSVRPFIDYKQFACELRKMFCKFYCWYP